MEKRSSAPIKRRAQEPEDMIGPCSSSSVTSQDQSLQNPFKRPLPPPQQSQDEPIDLSLSVEERQRRSRFWAFVERKQQRGEVVLMSLILLLFLCSTGATLNGFEISLDANALPSVVRPAEDQTQNLQPVLYNAVPVLDSSGDRYTTLRVVVPVEPKSSPAISDRPTNGFWPNPQAVRMFLGRNPNQHQPDTGSIAAKGPPIPSILIHQAIYPPVDEAITYPVTPEGTWDIYPGHESVPTLNPIVIEGVPTPGPVVIQPTLKPEIPLQPTLKPEIPLSVLVHLISGGMGEGSGEDVYETSTPRTSDEILPSFLIGVPDDVVQDYFKIKNNQELTKGEVKTSLEQLKLKLPPDSRKNFENLQLENEQFLAMERSRQAERIASMGEMAKQVAEQIQVGLERI
ncbi:unnamed protein product [Haemonchus placei]|uniref:DUF928 domain-containing protein n=1 Tax=Haemonchus placei TaxID=6290 RepID=A0A0N4WN82_HAEPC|nr:unnamed protein product [Haemonchus placei]